MNFVWVLVVLEVALFFYAIGVYIWELTLGVGDINDTYRATHFYRTIIALFLILLAWDNRKLFKGYLVLFFMILVSGIVVAVDATIYLPTSNSKAYGLNVASAWAHVAVDVIVLVWYAYMVCWKDKKKTGWEEYKQMKN